MELVGYESTEDEQQILLKYQVQGKGQPPIQ